jgi:hypothetical protein
MGALLVVLLWTGVQILEIHTARQQLDALEQIALHLEELGRIAWAIGIDEREPTDPEPDQR